MELQKIKKSTMKEGFSTDIQVQEEEKSSIINSTKTIPRYLYRYRSFPQFSFHEIRSGYILLATPQMLNDPYECILFCDEEKLKSNILKHIQTKKPEFPEELIQTIANDEIDMMIKNTTEKYQSRFCMASFAEDFRSMPMWAHYAHNHTGICIEYDTSLFDEKTKEKIFQISYVEKGFDITDIIIDALHYLDNGKSFSEIPTKNLWQIALIKSQEWKYEREWRLIKLFPETKEGERLCLGHPKRIFAGSKILSESEAKLRELCNSLGIPLIKVKRSLNKFSMESVTF